MKPLLTRLAAMSGALAVTAVAASGAQAAEPVEIKVSYQPAVYWALPFYVATEKGWWEQMGLKPVFSVFPAGVPQMAASASKSWDVGSTGSVPAILGFHRFGIKTIGISNDESQGNALVVSKGVYDGLKANPKDLKGKTIVLTANSTGDYAVQSCLRKFGLDKSEVMLKNMGQAEIISAMSSGNADYSGVWAPNIYTLEERAGAKVLCSGKDAGAYVPGALVARGDYAKEHPENVAKFLAVYLHAWNWLNANRKEAIELMEKFYSQGGVKISEASMNKEFDTRPTYDLTQQIKLFDRAGGASEADKWFAAIGEFMKASGALAKVQPAEQYMDGSFLKRVADDPKLSAYANGKD